MSNLEEAKRLVGKAVGLEPPCFHCMGKGYLTKSMECPKCKGNTLSIMAYVSHIRENANNALLLLENMKEEVNRADGPKSPCCGVPMVWINSRQRYICPNCGNYPSEKPAEEPRPFGEPPKHMAGCLGDKCLLGCMCWCHQPAEKSYEDSEIVELRRKIHTEEPGCPLSNAMGGEEPCSHPPDQQYQVQADITDDTVDPGFYCRLCRKKVSEYGPTEEPKKSWPPRDANGLTDQQKYPVIEEPKKEKEDE